MRISHNLMAMNADRMLGLTKAKAKTSVEKLSSGYKVNRAADDAAGLAISEKMRRMIRGLNQGTENAEDGVSWTQIGDGALDEAQAIIHRMTELTVQSLNGTYSDSDRMAMEMEFEALQCELDRISTTTEFNEMPIFDQHDIPYYQCEGAVKWEPQQQHVVTAGENDLTFTYRKTKEGTPQTMTVTVPAGEYTTQELVDEIESALYEKNSSKPKMVLEFTKDGYCNANAEGGEMIDSVSGGLSYLLYDMYKGGSYGALIGTTSFPDETSELDITQGKNDTMSFTIESFAGGTQMKSITLPQGSYNRSTLIDLINNQLQDTTVRAVAYGTGIKLASEDAMVTGFKGNMFKIDSDGTIHTSVFYDNVNYGTVSQTKATFTGGYVLPTNSRDQEHRYYRIDSSNNKLILQPNTTAQPVEIEIPDGEYTAQTMKEKLTELFAAKGVDVTVERIYSGGFEGLKLTSTLAGPDSKIGMDISGSAYNTLFVSREYNTYSTSGVASFNETRANKEGVLKGSRDLSSLTTTPLVITDGSNDAFELKLNGATTGFTIKLTAKTYRSVEEVRAEIDQQLNGSGAAAGYKGKIVVTAEAGKIILTGAAGQSVDKIRVEAVSSNDGFDAVFQGYRNVSNTANASGTGSVTLNTPYDGNIDASEKNMTIRVDGVKYDVTLPEGAVSPDTIKATIETAIPGKTVTTNKTFTTVTDNGSNNSRHFTANATGTENVATWTPKTETGTGTKVEGMAGVQNSTPAVLKIVPKLKDSMLLTSANNRISLSLNGRTETLVLTAKATPYTPAELAAELQKQIDDTFGKDVMGSAKVSLNGKEITLTSCLPANKNGSDTSIHCSTSTSSFLRYLNTTEGPAVWTSGNTLASSIAVNDSNKTFSFNYTENGTTRTINLELTPGTYSSTTIATEINTQLAKTGTGIKAEVVSGKLRMTTTAVGKGVSINYATANGGTADNALFGPLETPEAAEIVVGLDTESSIKIETGVNDTFSIKVNGATKTVTLQAGTYDRDSFVTMLNGELTKKNAGVEVFKSGNRLGYRTVDKGASTSISMSYSDGGTSMKAIYGVNTTEYPGVKVSFDADGRMVLNTEPDSSLLVYGSSGGAFQQPVVTQEAVSPTVTDGYHSGVSSYIDGVNLSGDVVINQWNNDLNFTYLKNGTAQTVSVEIPQDTYTQDELQTKLQELLDAEVGSNQIKATVKVSGVRLEAVQTGNQYQFSNFSGDFYDKVICKCVENSYNEIPQNADGSQNVSPAYTVGRKDVRTATTEIRNGISDELTLDFTYGGTVHTINMKLDAGDYTGQQLVEQVQSKLNEQLLAMGLQEDLIEVGIGGITTNVAGANDQNAINFQLSKTVQMPAGGSYVIDGVRGNAAFEIFYQTDGSNEPAYIMGTKDVSAGVVISPGKDTLSFEADGVPYEIQIPEGSHSVTELKNVINDALDAAGAPAVAEVAEGRLKLSHRKLGQHEISNVSGSAKSTLFFKENGATGDLTKRHVQLSSEAEDKISLNRHVFNTVSLGLNSCCISQIKNAEKALNRLDGALRMMSEMRSDFGSTQNRLEHAIANNENKAENLQSAESVIRDTDMAKEMMKLSTYNILQQAGEAMLAQANQSYQGVLGLLQQ